MSVAFLAEYKGVCACCDTAFAPGTEVTYDSEGNLLVVQCPNAEPATLTPEQRAALRAKMCPSCFMVHAGECL